MKPEETRHLLGNGNPPRVRGPLDTLTALVTGGVLLVLGVTFSLVILVIVALLGSLGFGYFWWKTRALRKQLREQIDLRAEGRPATAAGQGDTPQGEIIEGVVIREERENSQ